ncbi:GMC oxidoreductase [Bisporella sp. PMI_857]|nr:GMC oxidoreductase [Bisporella sp. PMI_857]
MISLHCNQVIRYIAFSIFYLTSLLTCPIEAQFDYLVVGGGTGGLAVASRLSDDPSVQVGVIEAGDSVVDDPDVADPMVYLNGGTPYLMWGYESIPQAVLGNRTIWCAAGRALGGTSTVNGMTYLRAEKVQLDAWEALGNPTLNWDELLPYYQHSENLTVPTTGETFYPEYHGFSGPLHTGWQASVMRGNATTMFIDTWANLGLPYNPDPNSGAMAGSSVWPFTVDATTGVRSDCARSYYLPVANRTNLHVFLNTTAMRLTWRDDTNTNNSTASGVQATSSTGDVITFNATREVIVSLGAMRTPPFLEHSGIGNPSILNEFGIPVRVDLPAVGENFQDHPSNGISAPLIVPNGTFVGFPPYVAYPTAADVFGADVDNVLSRVRAAIPSYAAIIAAGSRNSTTAKMQEELLARKIDTIFGDPTKTPLGEVFLYPDAPRAGGFSFLNVWPSIPFSQGSVHIASSDPLTYPAIDYNFHQVEADVIMQTGLMRYVRRFFSTPPYSAVIGPETSPGLDAVPLNATDAQWGEWIRANVGSTAHMVGSAAMRSRELGGVVDSELRVYGTSNVRVVDVSMWSTHLSGHLTSTVYMTAEKAADLIRQANSASDQSAVLLSALPNTQKIGKKYILKLQNFLVAAILNVL